MSPHPDGSLRAERVISRAEGERQQVIADMYGDTPMLSTGMHLRTVGSVLTELIGQLDISAAEIAPEMLKQAWQQAAGSFLATQAELVSLVNGQAVICTSHPAVRYELLQHRQEIIRALNATLGEGCVQTVRLMHG